jgi:hypothetical protein
MAPLAAFLPRSPDLGNWRRSSNWPTTDGAGDSAEIATVRPIRSVWARSHRKPWDSLPSRPRTVAASTQRPLLDDLKGEFHLLATDEEAQVHLPEAPKP